MNRINILCGPEIQDCLFVVPIVIFNFNLVIVFSED